MRNIAFYGGGVICQLGPVSDVVLFFDCIRAFVTEQNEGTDWTLLTDALYRRYLRDTEFALAVGLMARVKAVFQQTPAPAVDWNPTMSGDSAKSILDPCLPTLGNVYARYFDALDFCVESARLFSEEWKIPQIIRIVVADSPAFIQDRFRGPDEYDALGPGDKPFWLR